MRTTRRSDDQGGASTTLDAASSATESVGGPTSSTLDERDASTTEVVDAPPAKRDVRARMEWGGARGQLGRERPQEGNPEGPMSFALAGDDLLVLDQVNGRLSRYGRDGRLLSSVDATPTSQEVIVAKDGTVAVLDRLVGKSVALTDARGRRVGDLSLEGKIDQPGLVTGLVVDGKNVYAEREHGALVPIGTIDGRPPPDDAEELSGRPSRDGALLLSATLAPGGEGRVILNAFDRRQGSIRFARMIPFARSAHRIVMLDSDLRGVLYLGVAAGEPESAHIACVDSVDGHVTGRLSVPMSNMPEESFRDFDVHDDGTIVYALRTESGVEYLEARCP